jgi:hypothetical protein
MNTFTHSSPAAPAPEIRPARSLSAPSLIPARSTAHLYALRARKYPTAKPCHPAHAHSPAHP